MQSEITITKLNESKVAKAGDLMTGGIQYDKTSEGFHWTVDNGDRFQLRTYSPDGLLQVIKTRNGREWGAMEFLSSGGFNITAYNGEDGQTPYTLHGSADGHLFWRGQNMIFVKESWVSGTSWYRVWSDGYIEQGGQLMGSPVTVTLFKQMGNIDYSIFLTSLNYYGNHDACIANVESVDRTVSSFVFRVKNYANQEYSNTVWWMVRGY